MEKKPYKLTEHAGTHVAGRRIEDRNAPLHLTEAEAAYELQIMAIRPWPEVQAATTVEQRPAAPADEPSKPRSKKR
ncbi:MAG: hypothetical protein M9955_15680 [Rhizobiaceae bacterium]|nr:hypothetical protein [Rhizobiaceae bacterium]